MKGSEFLALVLSLLIAAPMLYVLHLRLRERIKPARGSAAASLILAAVGTVVMIFEKPRGNFLYMGRDMFWNLYWAASALVEWRQLRRTKKQDRNLPKEGIDI